MPLDPLDSVDLVLALLFDPSSVPRLYRECFALLVAGKDQLDVVIELSRRAG